MPYSRQDVVDILQRAGFRDAADKASQELPDSMDLDGVQKWADQHGITRDVLVSAMGGSP